MFGIDSFFACCAYYVKTDKGIKAASRGYQNTVTPYGENLACQFFASTKYNPVQMINAMTERLTKVMILFTKDDFCAPSDTMIAIIKAKVKANKSGKLPMAGTFHVAMSFIKNLYM